MSTVATRQNNKQAMVLYCHLQTMRYDINPWLPSYIVTLWLVQKLTGETHIHVLKMFTRIAHPNPITQN